MQGFGPENERGLCADRNNSLASKIDAEGLERNNPLSLDAKVMELRLSKQSCYSLCGCRSAPTDTALSESMEKLLHLT